MKCVSAIIHKDMDKNIHFPRPMKLTFYFFFITHMLKEGSPSVQDSFILHPIVIKKKKRMLRLLLQGATWSSPASGQVNLQAAVHVNRAKSLFLWCLLLLHAALLLSCRRICRSHIASSSNLERAPTWIGRENHLNPAGWMLGVLPFGICKRKRWKGEKKYQKRKFGVSGVLVMIVCGNPASVLSSLNTHCIKMYTLTHTHAHPPTQRKRQGVRLVHSGSLASSQPLNTSTAQYSVEWQALSHMLALRKSDIWGLSSNPASATVTYICHPFIHLPHSYHMSLCISVLLTLPWRAQSSSFCSHILLSSCLLT